MVDLELHVLDTHAVLTFPIKDQDSKTVDLTDAASVNIVVRPEQQDEATKACSITANVDSGTLDGATSGSVLTVSGQNFLTTITVGDLLVITTGNDIGEYVVTEVTSDTELTVEETFVGDTAQTWYVTDGSVTVSLNANMLNSGDQEVRCYITWNDATVSPTTTQFIIKGLT